MGILLWFDGACCRYAVDATIKSGFFHHALADKHRMAPQLRACRVFVIAGEPANRLLYFEQ
jgi:hypothetical protein